MIYVYYEVLLYPNCMLYCHRYISVVNNGLDWTTGWSYYYFPFIYWPAYYFSSPSLFSCQSFSFCELNYADDKMSKSNWSAGPEYQKQNNIIPINHLCIFILPNMWPEHSFLNWIPVLEMVKVRSPWFLGITMLVSYIQSISHTITVKFHQTL